MLKMCEKALAIYHLYQKRRVPSEEVQDTIMSEEEKRVIATHISGHVVASLFMSTQPRIKEVSITPHNTKKRIIWNNDNKKYSSKTELMEKLAVLLAGRAAEKEIIGDISTAASKDILVATKIATKMVIVYGMDSKFGPISIKGINLKKYDLLSEKILSNIDDRISQIIKEEEERTVKLIHVNQELVENLIQVLIEKETVSGEEIQQIYNEYDLKYAKYSK